MRRMSHHACRRLHCCWDSDFFGPLGRDMAVCAPQALTQLTLADGFSAAETSWICALNLTSILDWGGVAMASLGHPTAAVSARKRFRVVLIKPSHYDDDGY